MSCALRKQVSTPSVCNLISKKKTSLIFPLSSAKRQINWDLAPPKHAFDRTWIPLKDAVPVPKEARKQCADLLPNTIVAWDERSTDSRVVDENANTTPEEETKKGAISDNTQEEEQNDDGSFRQTLSAHVTDWLGNLVTPVGAAAVAGGSILLQSRKDTAQARV